MRTNDLLNAVHFVAVRLQEGNAGQNTSETTQQADLPAVVGQQYYALKQTLIADEQFLLRTINFDIVAAHPHKYIFNFGSLIGIKHTVMQLAVSILNDSVVYTKLCLLQSPADIAAACLQLAFELLSPTVQLPFLESKSGWNAVGVMTQQVEAIGIALLDMILSNAEQE